MFSTCLFYPIVPTRRHFSSAQRFVVFIGCIGEEEILILLLHVKGYQQEEGDEPEKNEGKK